MKVLNLPFTLNMGIEESNQTDFLLKLNRNEKILNHLNTIHGSASFSLAEITSGYFLQIYFSDIAEQTIPILRSSTIKYKKASFGELHSKARLKVTTIESIREQLLSKQKALFTIVVNLYDQDNQLVVNSEFEWFVTMNKTKIEIAV